MKRKLILLKPPFLGSTRLLKVYILLGTKKPLKTTSTFPSFRCEVSTSHLEKYWNWYHSWSQQNSSYSNFIPVNKDHTSGSTLFRAPRLYCSGSSMVRSTDWDFVFFLFFSIFAAIEKKQPYLTIPRLSKSMVIQCNKLLIDSKIEPLGCRRFVRVLSGATNQSGPNMGVSKNRVFPQIINFNRVFHYFHHPFWGIPFVWKHPKKNNEDSFMISANYIWG